MSEIISHRESRPATAMTCVCCNCQRQRTPAGDWCPRYPVEGERITHGLCPCCLSALYPDIAPLVLARA